MTTPDPDTLSRLLTRGRAMVRDLCKREGEPGWRRWTMSIPARPDHDPDLVIAAALAAGEEAVAELARVKGERDRLRDLVRHQRGELHDAGLITDEEYAALAADHGAVKRLEGYDEIRRQRDEAVDERDALYRDYDAAYRAMAEVNPCAGHPTEPSPATLADAVRRLATERDAIALELARLRDENERLKETMEKVRRSVERARDLIGPVPPTHLTKCARDHLDDALSALASDERGEAPGAVHEAHCSARKGPPGGIECDCTPRAARSEATS